MMTNEYLLMFKKLELSKSQLVEKLGGDFITICVENPEKIYTTDVINLLSSYRENKITLNQLIDWVNTIWFTELFEYDDNQCDSIASVLNKLEELDEEGNCLTESDIDLYIDALSKNTEV